MLYILVNWYNYYGFGDELVNRVGIGCDVNEEEDNYKLLVFDIEVKVDRFLRCLVCC